MHHTYLLALSALFLLVFAVMLHSLIAHRRQQASSDAAARRFYGPTGTVQWLWASVPLAILAAVSIALLSSADDSAPTTTPKTTIATNHAPSLK